ncbi:hypothetical protein CLV30_12215 [Haloactinopolyspora alba]|uniref:Secreted protein n=1 Tax=Haloactinopolyspora alba TaxID=648780 RepID=A0A2P8DJX7_9ACTN|nr:hypothetical protein [Haloactinopolyspora alba]PSK97523.1 hypothetical protein CLV30_12215 [Haloactinopolyspora alba]
MNKVLRGALVAGASLAACVGFTSTASATEADSAGVPEVTEMTEAGDINILNDACVLPWFWQGPFNVLVENQDGSYTACNGMDSDEAAAAEGINFGNDVCALPWFWQGPFNVFVGNQNGEYVACNGGGAEVPAELEGEIKTLLPEGTPLTELLPEGTQLLP